MGSINHLSNFFPNAPSLTDQLRPLIREEKEKIRLPVKKFEWGKRAPLSAKKLKKQKHGLYKLTILVP